jgi:ElaB/YqjD/DUF883 family membrane-anchored ribosome-binding protein
VAYRQANGFHKNDIPLLIDLGLLEKKEGKIVQTDAYKALVPSDFTVFLNWALGTRKYPLPEIVRDILCRKWGSLSISSDSMDTAIAARPYQKNSMTEIQQMLETDGLHGDIKDLEQCRKTMSGGTPLGGQCEPGCQQQIDTVREEMAALQRELEVLKVKKEFVPSAPSAQQENASVKTHYNSKTLKNNVRTTNRTQKVYAKPETYMVNQAENRLSASLRTPSPLQPQNLRTRFSRFGTQPQQPQQPQQPTQSRFQTLKQKSKNFYGKSRNFTRKALGTVANVGTATGQAIRRGATATGEALGSVGTATGQAIRRGATATGEALGSVGTATGQAIRRGATATGQAIRMGATATGQAIRRGATATGEALGSVGTAMAKASPFSPKINTSGNFFELGTRPSKQPIINNSVIQKQPTEPSEIEIMGKSERTSNDTVGLRNSPFGVNYNNFQEQQIQRPKRNEINEIMENSRTSNDTVGLRNSLFGVNYNNFQEQQIQPPKPNEFNEIMENSRTPNVIDGLRNTFQEQPIQPAKSELVRLPQPTRQLTPEQQRRVQTRKTQANYNRHQASQRASKIVKQRQPWNSSINRGIAFGTRYDAKQPVTSKVGQKGGTRKQRKSRHRNRTRR